MAWNHHLGDLFVQNFSETTIDEKKRKHESKIADPLFFLFNFRQVVQGMPKVTSYKVT